jgi:hypothetical protein
MFQRNSLLFIAIQEIVKYEWVGDIIEIEESELNLTIIIVKFGGLLFLK